MSDVRTGELLENCWPTAARELQPPRRFIRQSTEVLDACLANYGGSSMYQNFEMPNSLTPQTSRKFSRMIRYAYHDNGAGVQSNKSI